MSDPAAAPAASNAGPSPASAPAATPWYAARNDADFTGYLQNRGLDKKSPDEAAFETYKAHSEATQMISRLSGTPDKDRIIIQPKPDATEAERNAFYQKLGRPADPKDYDFAGLKFPDGDEVDDSLIQVFRQGAFKANLSKEAATTFAKDVLEYIGKAADTETAEATARIASESAELQRNWGGNFEANKFIAQQGALKLGIAPEAVQAMEKAVGYKAVMEGFLKAGIAFGEDRFVANRAPNMQGVMTREQAGARLKELKAETGPDSWGARVMRGDVKAKQEFEALTAMMAGIQQAA